MKLAKITDFNLKNKKVLVRCDFDISVDGGKIRDNFRLQTLLPTINYLIKKSAKIILLGHRGRPMGMVDGQLSLAPIAKSLEKVLKKKINFIYDITGQEAGDEINKIAPGEMVMLENLRFDKGEEENSSEFAKKLANLGNFYINESFADSHREHTSIIGLAKLLSHAAGFHLLEEVENLSKVLPPLASLAYGGDNPKSPVVIIIGGAKTDKAKYIDKLLNLADWVLVGGVLPRFVKSYCRDDGKVCVSAAHLTPGGRDIDSASATNFAAIVANAETIIWNGPLGEYEKEEFKKGTEVVARAVAENKEAFKVVGGDDTVACLKSLGFLSKMNWVSTGGGAMLEYLTNGTLPGIEVLK